MVVFSLGPERVKEALRKALAVGAARAVHLSDPAFAGGDALATGRALAAALARDAFDLVLTGSQSDDVGYGGTGSVLAGHLGWPHVWLVMGVELEEGRPERQGDPRDGERRQRGRRACRLPAVLEIQAGINHPRYASLKGIMAAKKKEIADRHAGRPRARPRAGRRGGLAAGDRLGQLPGVGQGAQMLEGDAKAAAKTGRETAEGSEGALMAKRVWVVLQHREGQFPVASPGRRSPRRRSWPPGARGGKAEAVLLGAGMAAAAERWPRFDLAAVRPPTAPALARLHAGRLHRRARTRDPAGGAGLRGLPAHLSDGRLHGPPGAGDRRRAAARGDRLPGGGWRPRLDPPRDGRQAAVQGAGQGRGDGARLRPVRRLSGRRRRRRGAGAQSGRSRVDLRGSSRTARCSATRRWAATRSTSPRRRSSSPSAAASAARTRWLRSRARQGARRRDRRQPAGDRQRLAAARPPDRLLGTDGRAPSSTSPPASPAPSSTWSA